MHYLFKLKTGSIVFFACVLLLSACQGATTEPASTVYTFAPCPTTAPEDNIYSYPPEGLDRNNNVTNIFLEGLNNRSSAQKKALFYLGEHVAHGADYRDIVTDNGQIIRITVVFIGPALIQYVFLNHALYVNNQIFESFNEELKARLNRIGERDEIIFFVIITLPDYSETIQENDSLVVNLPIGQMMLKNAANRTIRLTHDDHILDEKIPIMRGPISGYVAYPLSIRLEDNSCVPVTDRKWNTSITLDVPHIYINGIDYGERFWSIQYSPLVAPLESSLPFQDIGLIENIKPQEEPLRVDKNISREKVENHVYWDAYWQAMGQYIWYRMILENYP